MGGLAKMDLYDLQKKLFLLWVEEAIPPSASKISNPIKEVEVFCDGKKIVNCESKNGVVYLITEKDNYL